MQNVYFWWMNPIFGFNFGFQFWDDFNSHTNVMDYLRKSHRFYKIIHNVCVRMNTTFFQHKISERPKHKQSVSWNVNKWETSKCANLHTYTFPIYSCFMIIKRNKLYQHVLLKVRVINHNETTHFEWFWQKLEQITLMNVYTYTEIHSYIHTYLRSVY